MAEELELSQKKKVEEAVRLLRSVTGGNGAAAPSLFPLPGPSGLSTPPPSRPGPSGLKAEGIYL